MLSTQWPNFKSWTKIFAFRRAPHQTPQKTKGMIQAIPPLATSKWDRLGSLILAQQSA